MSKVSKTAEDAGIPSLPDELVGSVMRGLLHGDIISKRALLQLGQTSQPLRRKVRSEAKALRVVSMMGMKKSQVRNLSPEERCLIKFTAAMVVTLRYDPAALSEASPESIAHALSPSPWCEWKPHTPEIDEIATERYVDGLAPTKRELSLLPPALVAIAASDMRDDQKHFFIGQSCGEMIIEHDLELDVKGAVQLGKILGVEPLMRPTDFMALLMRATRIQENRLRYAGLPSHVLGMDSPVICKSSPLALIASWCETRLARPARLSFEPKWPLNLGSAEEARLWAIVDGIADDNDNSVGPLCPFSQVLDAILNAMPSKVESEYNEDVVIDEDIAIDEGSDEVRVPRGLAEQYDGLHRWLLAAKRALVGAVELANIGGKEEANNDEARLLLLLSFKQAADLAMELRQTLEEECHELAELEASTPSAAS